jgi:hypothetical protein
MVDSRMAFSNFVVALARSVFVRTGEITDFPYINDASQSEPTITQIQSLRTIPYVNTTVQELQPNVASLLTRSILIRNYRKKSN